jgi:hypothetical protein
LNKKGRFARPFFMGIETVPGFCSELLARHSREGGAFNSGAGHPVLSWFRSSSRASTPPAEERVTSFFARAKKKVTKKESTLRGAPGGAAHERTKAA